MDKNRLATFFLLIGVIMLILFFGTDQSQNPQYILFFGGTPLTALGAWMLWTNRKPPEPTTRFSGLRRLLNRGKGGPPKKGGPPGRAGQPGPGGKGAPPQKR